MAIQNAPRDDNRVTTLLGVDNVSFEDPTTVAVDPTTHALVVSGTFSPAANQTVDLNRIKGTATDVNTGNASAGTLRVVIASDQPAINVNASFTPSGTQDVNLTKVGGSAFALGQQLAAASLPVVLTAAQISTLTPLTSVTVTQATGTNLHAVIDTGSTTAVTGNVTVVQPTGTNLHAVIDTGSTTAVTGNVTVVQATGTNLHTVIDSGTITTVSAVTAITNALPAGNNNIGDVDVATIPGIVGTVADDATTPGNPVMTGGMAVSPDGSDPGSVAENDVVRFKSDLNRRQLVNVEHPNWVSFHSDGSSALTDSTVFNDPGDGFQIVVTEIIFSTGAGTACNIFFEEGSTKVLGPWYLEAVAGRGVFWQGHKHITASTALTVTTSAAIAQSLDVQGYIQAV